MVQYPVTRIVYLFFHLLIVTSAWLLGLIHCNKFVLLRVEVKLDCLVIIYLCVKCLSLLTLYMLNCLQPRLGSIVCCTVYI